MFVNLLDIGGAVVPCFFGVSLSSSGAGSVTVLCGPLEPVSERDGVGSVVGSGSGLAISSALPLTICPLLPTMSKNRFIL